MPAPGSPAGPGRPDADRLAGPLAALSMVSDLARGRPPEEAMRACLLATRLAGLLGLDEDTTAAVWLTTMLRFVGCTATSMEYARAFGGDDVAVRAGGDLIDPAVPAEALGFLWGLGTGLGPVARAGRFVATAPGAARVIAEGTRADCEVATRMARRFRLGAGVETALGSIFERWDGRGGPARLAGEAVPLPARVAAAAFTAVMFAAAGGSDAAADAVGRWSGRALDPDVAAALTSPDGRALLAGLDEVDDVWAAVVDAEPGRPLLVGLDRLDEVAAGFADLADLKSPWLHGHSSGVAEVAGTAAGLLGLEPDEVAAVRRAGLLHDVGRAGVPSGIWDQPGRLTTAQWEQVRLHPYHTERILCRAPLLAGPGALAGAHHERLDGSGYHRASPAQVLRPAARVLAAADVWQALVSERPWRPALGPAEAARTLEAEAGLDRDGVAAVIEAAGQRARRPVGYPAGLTAREVEVLRLLVTGRSERRIGADLFISASTVHTHVMHIYAKAEVSTRAGAAVFAMEHGLTGPIGPSPGT
jgi:HD-GYP domain-containing protein (c-di-GMP phosphodiesterase class II)